MLRRQSVEALSILFEVRVASDVILMLSETLLVKVTGRLLLVGSGIGSHSFFVDLVGSFAGIWDLVTVEIGSILLENTALALSFNMLGTVECRSILLVMSTVGVDLSWLSFGSSGNLKVLLLLLTMESMEILLEDATL